MTYEDKELLLQDLCARLPYGVLCNIGLKYPFQLQRIFVDRLDGILLDFYEDGDNYQVYLSEVKPYLRPMSSMTEEEWTDYQKIRMIDWVNGDINGTFINAGLIVDWLNKNHFDYRGLIPKGLAFEAPEGMYK